MDFTTRMAPGHTCPRPATVAVEGYSPRDGRAHGSLDRVARVCDDHAETARTWMGHLMPYRAIQGDIGHRIPCGEITDYTDD
jgi:hypothetical protein